MAGDHACRADSLPHRSSRRPADAHLCVEVWSAPPAKCAVGADRARGMGALLERLAGAYGDWVKDPGFAIKLREIAPGEAIDLSPTVRLSALKVPHTDESVAYSIERGNRRIVYTG